MNEVIAPADFDFSREHTIKFTLADQSAINFFFTAALMRCPSTGIERPSRLTNRRKMV
jgi:hypothetical protein